jgi:hypothetical protein
MASPDYSVHLSKLMRTATTVRPMSEHVKLQPEQLVVRPESSFTETEHS